MAKAITIKKTGSSDNLAFEDVPMPQAGPGELIVRNTAIGVNFIDIYMRTGLYPLEMPAILGKEGVGIVEEIGEGVTQFQPGDRVAYLTDSGAYATHTNAPAAMTLNVPDSVKDETAAAILLKGLTVHMLVRQVYGLQAGDTALVFAAAGGVGSLLCQWANYIGARVIGVVGSGEKTGLAKFHGATNVINRTDVDDIAVEVQKLTNNQGVNVVYDSVGKDTFTASLGSLSLRGMLVTYGNASGPPPAIEPLELSRRGSITLSRPTLFHYATPDRIHAMADELFAMTAQGALKPPIPTTFVLEKAADAQDLLETGTSTGALILKP